MAAITIGTPALGGAVTGFNTSQLQPSSVTDIDIEDYNNIWTTSITRLYELQIDSVLPAGIGIQSADGALNYTGVSGSIRPAYGQLYPRGY